MNSLPDELNSLLDKQFLFMIRITEFNIKGYSPIFKVVKMSDEQKLIDVFLGLRQDTQVGFISNFYICDKFMIIFLNTLYN